MKIISTLAMLFAIVACDAPRTQRALSSGSSSSLTGGSTGVNLGSSSDAGSGSGGGSSSSGTTTPTTSTIPSDASHCKFSTDGSSGYESTSSHLGEYTLCQSSSDKNSVYFQVKTPPTNSNGDISICLIPTTNSGSNSIYVGNPMCGYFKDPKSVRKISFIKYAAYSSATITGVIFFKDLSWYYGYPFNQYVMTLDAYKTCMNMLAYPYYNSSYCTAFKNVGQYVYKQF